MTAQDSRLPRLFAVLEFVRQRQVARRLASVLTLAAAACTDIFEPPASRIAPVEGNNQFGLAGLALAKPLSVKLTDSFLNPIAGVPVRFDIVAGGGTIAGGTATTSAAGIATSGAWTLGSRGPQQVRARSQGTEVVFDARACASIAWGCDDPEAAQSVIIFAGGPGNLFRSAVDNPKPVQITQSMSGDTHVRNPEWSPDGSRVAFVRFAQNRFDIHIIRAGGELTPRTTDGNYFHPTWSPDGRQLAVAKLEPMGFGIYVMSADADGKPPLRLTAGWNPTWSPDGLRIAFDNNRGGIDRVNVDGTGLTSLISAGNGRGFSGPAWSPDGRSIAVMVIENNCDLDEEGGGSCDTAIGVLEPGATEIRLIARGPKGRSSVSEPTWSPDGSTIAFTKESFGINGWSMSVSAVQVDGTNERMLIANGASPTWRR
ncbi:MAG: hypothetical protein WKF55_14520 [Gemmatimonadaceae bacterium]